MENLQIRQPNTNWLELNFSPNKNEKCFMIVATTEFEGDCGITIGNLETMKKLGWDEYEIENLEISQRIDSYELGDAAFIVRIG